MDDKGKGVVEGDEINLFSDLGEGPRNMESEKDVLGGDGSDDNYDDEDVNSDEEGQVDGDEGDDETEARNEIPNTFKRLENEALAEKKRKALADSQRSIPMAPRWKWKGAEAEALAEPISKSVSELQLSLAKTEPSGTLSSCNVLLAVEREQADLLDRCCFGKVIISADEVKNWVQLSFEEAFFLFYNLKCIKLSLQGRCLENEVDTWMYMKSKRPNFPMFYKAYSHLRSKNWVLRSGLQYGVDFVAYHHHPSLVHSKYSVLVQSGDSDRLRVWSDIHCAVRLSGSVAKTLLLLYVNGNFKGEDLNLPVCLENFTVEEQTIRRWKPELSREL